MYRFIPPNIPTFVLKLICFIIGTVMIIGAVNTKSITLGICALIINAIDYKIDYKK